MANQYFNWFIKNIGKASGRATISVPWKNHILEQIQSGFRKGHSSALLHISDDIQGFHIKTIHPK